MDTRLIMTVTEQEASILRNCYKVLDYKLKDTNYQLEALERQSRTLEQIKEREGQQLLDKTRIIAHLKSGGEFEIDHRNRVEANMFIHWRNEGMIEIFEKKRNQYIAKWRVKNVSNNTKN